MESPHCCAIWRWEWRSPVGPTGDWPAPPSSWIAPNASRHTAKSIARGRNSIIWPRNFHPHQHRSKSMLSQAQRTTILELKAQGVSRSEIARVLNVTRLTVRKILRSNSTEVPAPLRPEKAEPHRQQILELLNTCKGNLVRVGEELAACGVNQIGRASCRERVKIVVV